MEVKAQLNTGLGRNAFLYIYGDSIKSSSATIEIRQEPRKLNESETIDVTIPYSLPLEILLGNDSTNLRRMKNLSFIGQVYPESLLIPSSATGISSQALVGLQARELHIGLKTPPTMSGTVYSGCTLYVPKGCTEKYKSANYWKDYKKMLEE